MKVKYFSIPVILLVLLSGILLISGSAVNSAYARYATGANTQTQANSNECDNTATCAITSPLVQGDRSTSAATNTQNPQFNEEGEGHLSGSSIESTPGPTTPGGPTTPATSTVELSMTIQCDESIEPGHCLVDQTFESPEATVTTDALSPSTAVLVPAQPGAKTSATFTFAFPSTYQIELQPLPVLIGGCLPHECPSVTSITSSPSCLATLDEDSQPRDQTSHISGNVPPPGQSTECDITLKFSVSF